MPNPRKKAAENLLKRRKAEEEEETLTARVISRRGSSPAGSPAGIAKGRSIKLSDLTDKARKEYLYGIRKGDNPKNETNKEWYEDLAKNYPTGPVWDTGHLDTGIDKWLTLRKGMDVYNRPKGIEKLIKKGVLKHSLMPNVVKHSELWVQKEGFPLPPSKSDKAKEAEKLSREGAKDKDKYKSKAKPLAPIKKLEQLPTRKREAEEEERRGRTAPRKKMSKSKAAARKEAAKKMLRKKRTKRGISRIFKWAKKGKGKD